MAMVHVGVLNLLAVFQGVHASDYGPNSIPQSHKYEGGMTPRWLHLYCRLGSLGLVQIAWLCVQFRFHRPVREGLRMVHIARRVSSMGRRSVRTFEQRFMLPAKTC